MFTKITIKNFKTFKNVEINLSSKKNTPKKIVVIYGENGSGKTTILHAFYLLRRTMTTMLVKDAFNELLETYASKVEDSNNNAHLIELLNRKLAENSIQNIIKDYRTIGSDDNMSVKYDFIIDGNQGSYYIEMDSERIVKEHLEYKFDKRRGVYFDISPEKTIISTRVITNKDFHNIINDQIKKYWGKHSVLSILIHERMDKSNEYFSDNCSPNLITLLSSLNTYSYEKDTYLHLDNKPLNEILSNLDSGSIERDNLNVLKLVESMLNEFFKTIFKDVEEAFYKTSEKEKDIAYQLYLKKHIENTISEIPFNLESDGTKDILNLIPLFIAASSGETVIIDEFGNRIHSRLAADIIKSVSKQITGQLIMTTHNDSLIDSADLPPESIYFITENKSFHKSVKCISDIENRIHPNYNYRIRYYTNEKYLDSLPKDINEIDFSKILKRNI